MSAEEDVSSTLIVLNRLMFWNVRAMPGGRCRRWRAQSVAVQLDLAGVRCVEPRDDVEDCRLARAVRPDQACDDAAVDLEGDPVQRHDAAEPQRDVPHREQH
jgi:hypothetical protein